MAEPSESASPPPLRVIIQQPGLPKYRIPVFRELASRPGLELTVLHSGGGASDVPVAEAEGFAARRTPARVLLRWPRRVRWEPAQVASASRRACDVLVLEWNAGLASLVPALLLARLRGVGTVLWGHGYSKRERRAARWLRHGIGRLADCLLLYNHGAAAGVARGWPERVFVALNALDQEPIARARDTWRASPGRLAEFQEARGIAGRRVVLFVSRLEAVNGVDLLVRAAARLQEQRPELTVAIIGKGPAKADLERLAAELGVSDRVLFLGAIYEEEELAPWFLSSDIFCYPRNIGLSLLHALGYALPVVTDDNLIAQNPEIEALRTGVNGLLYAAGDEADLAATLERLLEDEGLRRRLSAEAERTVREKFTLSNMVDGMEAAVRYAASRRKRGD